MSPLTKDRRLLRSALIVSLALVFWTAQLLPVLANPACCQAQSAGGHQSSSSQVKHHGHSCCCGQADSHIGLKSQCCEVRNAARNPDQDFAVSFVPNLNTNDPIGVVAESRSDTDFSLCTGTSGALDWVKSKTLSKHIYLTNLNFLC